MPVRAAEPGKPAQSDSYVSPELITDPASFQRAAAKVGYTFNWFYTDADHIAYFNSGANPQRAKGIDNDFPVAAKFEWQGWNPDTWQATFTPPAEHPQAVDQSYFVNWNNKQAHGYRSADANAYSSTYRSVMLEERVKQGIAGAKKHYRGPVVLGRDLMEIP